MMVKCLRGNNHEAHSIILGIDVTGNVMPTKEAPNEPNIDIKLMIRGRLGLILNINTDNDIVAATKSIDVNEISNRLEANGIFTTLNSIIFAKQLMIEYITK